MGGSGSGKTEDQRHSAEHGLDIAGELLRLVGRRVAAHHVATAVEQELGEVPLDRMGA
jgi:hypothetical protein